MNLEHWVTTCHLAAHNWWHDAQGNRLQRNPGELMMLVVSELAEAMEGERKGLMDHKLPHRKMAEVEMADAFIRLCDFCGGFGLKLNRHSYVAANDGFNRGEYLLHLCSLAADVEFWLSRGHVNNASMEASELASSIQEYCRACGYDLEGAAREKLAFNATRIDHTHEHRAGVGGKKF